MSSVLDDNWSAISPIAGGASKHLNVLIERLWIHNLKCCRFSFNLTLIFNWLTFLVSWKANLVRLTENTQPKQIQDINSFQINNDNNMLLSIYFYLCMRGDKCLAVDMYTMFDWKPAYYIVININCAWCFKVVLYMAQIGLNH